MLTNPEGTVYFTSNSASGSKYYELREEEQDYISERSQLCTPNYSLIDVSNTKLTITTYNANTNEVLEDSTSYTIIKK